MSARPGSLWRNHNFTTLWLGESVSLVGTQVTALALPLAAVLLLKATPFQMGLLTAVEVLPILVLGLFVGVLVDRVPRRMLLVGANVGRALLLGAIPLAAFLGRLSMGELYAVAVGTGILSVAFDTAFQSYLPALVGREELVAANARYNASMSVAGILGPALGGALVSLITAPFAILLDAASYVFAAVCGLLIRFTEPLGTTEQQRGTVLHDVGEGLRFIVGQRALLMLVLYTGVSNICGGMLFAQQILFFSRDLGFTPTVIGAVVALAGPAGLVGALIAARIAARLGVGRALVLGAMFFVVGDFFLALAGGPAPVAIASVAVASLLIGFGSPLYNVTYISLRQSLAPEHLLGRVTATARVIGVGTLPLGAFLGGVLAGPLGLRPTLIVASCMAVPALGLLIAASRHVVATPAPTPAVEGVA